MTSPANGVPSPAPGRNSGLIRVLGNLLAPAAPTAPANGIDDLGRLLDQWKATHPTGPQADPLATPAVRQALAQLAVPGGAAAVTAAGWQALGQAWAGMDRAGRASLAARLAPSGVTTNASRDGVYVTFRDAQVTATVEPGSERLRIQRPDRAECYDRGALVATMGFADGRVTLDTAYGTEVWDAGGNGTLNGQPISAAPAARVPGEAPRRLSAAPPPPNELDEPEWKGKSWMKVYGTEYDEAIREAGGQVVEPTNVSRDVDVYNCHSFATTGGRGDLFDPFLRNGQPHWLDNPMRQLATSAWGRLAADQRVHPGDVVVYKKDGKVTHTGVVVAVDQGGNPVRVESKFGILGKYVHDTYDVSALYGQPAEFYRPAT